MTESWIRASRARSLLALMHAELCSTLQQAMRTGHESRQTVHLLEANETLGVARGSRLVLISRSPDHARVVLKGPFDQEEVLDPTHDEQLAQQARTAVQRLLQRLSAR